MLKIWPFLPFFNMDGKKALCYNTTLSQTILPGSERMEDNYANHQV